MTNIVGSCQEEINLAKRCPHMQNSVEGRRRGIPLKAWNKATEKDLNCERIDGPQEERVTRRDRVYRVGSNNIRNELCYDDDEES